jgi:phospholipid/cholesterol/gamma-HCH transport system permease protein
MRISDEIDALEVMGINTLVFLCATRLLAAWLVMPFMYIGAVGAGFFGSYLAGYTAGGGPVGVGTATAKSMVLNTVLVHLVSGLTRPRGAADLPSRRASTLSA